MPTMKKDFKNLTIPNQELSFSLGFTTALVFVAGIMKIFGVI